MTSCQNTSASLPEPLAFVFPCRSQFGRRNNVCQMPRRSVRFTGRCFEWSLRAEGRGFEMEPRACFPWRVRNRGVAMVVATVEVRRSYDPSVPLWYFLDRPHIARPRPWDVWWARPRQLASPLVICTTGVQASFHHVIQPSIQSISQRAL